MVFVAPLALILEMQIFCTSDRGIPISNICGCAIQKIRQDGLKNAKICDRHLLMMTSKGYSGWKNRKKL
ncbi:Hypothetical protein FKW44_000420 [Caligus rogercresseyi]|uniref:Uncharacterized protein n=1 Tax=Caligus rogercresseyi TaxID=217165 RepID=A0A7T8QUW5_CALRO|nr:Hypothetical protein FKW44_000420 [Caligus rogercresseyi]